MPRSKRDKEISLTKVKKKGRQAKESLIANLRKSIDEHEHLIVFLVETMRTSILNDLRKKYSSDSKFFFGSNKVMAVALGRTKSEEHKAQLSKLSAHLSGQCGLMVTNQDLKQVISYMEKFGQAEYARSGYIAPKTILLEAGSLDQFDHSLEPRLRKLGLPVTLKKSIINLEKDHTVCNKGEKLTPEQAKILQLFDYKLASCRLHPVCSWSTNDNSIVLYERIKKLKKKN